MFESAYGEMKSEMLDHQQTFFRSVEESENKFNDAVINIAEQWVKQAQEGNLDAVSDELAAVRLVCWGGAMLKKLTRAPEQLATEACNWRSPSSARATNRAIACHGLAMA